LGHNINMSYAIRATMPGVWRPAISESIDGQPLAQSVSELFFDFPYDRLPENKFLAFFLRPECMLAMMIFYLVSKPLFKAIAKFIDPKAGSFRASVAIHNLGLAIFSAVVAWNSWHVVVAHYMQEGLFSTYCDAEGTLWGASGFGAWAVVFYISKYYEFVDTWVLVFKGKKPSFLQIYHHTGIAFTMWGGVLSQSSWLMIVVLLNSVIHTLMYTYFLIKTISPTTEIKAAKNLTMAQIAQFYTGLGCSYGVFVMGDKCDTASSRFMLGCIHVYGYGLVALFMAFASRKYKK
jgi:hypothetical protein